METAKFAGLAAALGAMLYLFMPALPARAQSPSDEDACAKAGRSVPYAQQKKAFDKCMAEKTKAKDRKS
jgi:hypothetical protein